MRSQNEILNRSLRILAAGVFGVVFGISAPAHAQSPVSQAPRAPIVDGRGDEDGEILVLVYRGGAPTPGIEVSIGGDSRWTDADGAIRWRLPAGDHAILFPASGPEMVRATVIGRGETLVSANLVPEGVRFDTKTPGLGAPSGVPPLSAAEGPMVRVQVVADESGSPVAGAELRIGGWDGAARTNASGGAGIRLPPGRHLAIVTHPSYVQATLPFEVAAEARDLDEPRVLRLRAAGAELDEYVVLAPKAKGSVAALVEVRRASSAVAEVLGAEQMARQGDSDAGASLRRLAGLTLMGGKYVYVRGLGERYSSVQLNGLSLPSPEPSRRVVPLDLFPTAVLESVVVQKSSSADLPAEFGGGLIQLRTRSIPERFFARASVSTELADLEGRMASGPGGSTDWLGVDDGARAMPRAVRAALATGRKLNENTPPAFNDGFSAAELQAFGRALPNRWNVRPSSDPPLPGFAIAAGKGWERRDLSFGAAASALSATGVSVTERDSHKYNVGAGDQLVRDETARSLRTDVERSFGVALDLGGAYKKEQTIALTQLFVRGASDSVRVKEASSPSDSVARRKTSEIEWVERELLVQQVHGGHKIHGLMENAPEVRWRAGFSRARRGAPDTRQYAYVMRSDVYELHLDTTGNRRLYSDLTDRSGEAGFDFTLTPRSDLWSELKLRAGASHLARERRADTYRLHFKSRFSDATRPDLSQPPETLFAPGHVHPDGFVLTNLTESADSYVARTAIGAAFASFELSPVPSWQLVSGLRMENSRQEVATFYYYAPEAPTSLAGLRNRDLLPSHSLTWKPNPRWRARLAYGETLARPDARELSTVPYVDDESGYETVGNSGLETTVIRNVDHRWEYYFSSDEYVSVGAFFKHFEKPVEDVFEPSPNLRKTFANARSAENRGLEFETRTGLRSLARGLRRWTLLTNVSWIESRVSLRPGTLATSADRPLQGQSPYVVNVQLQYDRPAWGLSSTFLYNVIGPRITGVGTNRRPDVYEQPFHQLDWVTALKVAKNGSLGVKAKNLLDPVSRSLQGGRMVRSERKGRSVGLSLTLAI